MSKFLFFSAVALTVSVTGVGTRVHADVTANEVKHNTVKAADSAAAYAEQERDKYIRQAQMAIDKLRADIDGLGVKARAARDDVKAGLDANIKALDKKWDATESKLDEVKAANAKAWKKLKSGVDNAIEDLKQSFVRAKKEFI